MHICTRLFSPLLILASLVACTGEEPSGASFSRTSASGSDRNTPCFNNSCAQLEELLTVPDAENMIFSASGRLFVSGGQAVLEVVNNGNSFEAITVSSAACNFTGLTIARNTCNATYDITADFNADGKPDVFLSCSGLSNQLIFLSLVASRLLKIILTTSNSPIRRPFLLWPL